MYKEKVRNRERERERERRESGERIFSHFGLIRITIIQQCVAEMVAHSFKVVDGEVVASFFAKVGSTECGLQCKVRCACVCVHVQL